MLSHRRGVSRSRHCRAWCRAETRKPLCLAVTQGKPVVILPGFPTSAIFTFHEFVAPVLRLWAGHAERPRKPFEHGWH